MKRHAANAAELEKLLLEGFLSGEPVKEEITTEVASRACANHPESISTLLLPVLLKRPK